MKNITDEVKTRAIFYFFVFSVLMIAGNAYKGICNPRNNSSITECVEKIENIDLEKRIVLPDIINNEPGCGFTCTGLTYDSVTDTFWIGNYGKRDPSDKTKRPSIINLSKDFSSVIKEIYVKCDKSTNIQGVSYDSGNDTLWYTDTKKIINIDKEGHELTSFKLGKYQKYIPNGIAYDAESDSIFVLCYYNYLLQFSKKGEIKNVYICGYYDQDQLCLMENGTICFTAGADYNGNDNFLCVLGRDNQTIEKVLRLEGSYAVEGVYVCGEKLYVANDGLFHSDKINRNYISVYDLEYYKQ